MVRKKPQKSSSNITFSIKNSLSMWNFITGKKTTTNKPLKHGYNFHISYVKVIHKEQQLLTTTNKPLKHGYNFHISYVKVIHKEQQLLYTWKQLTSLWEYVQRDKYVYTIQAWNMV